MSKIKFPTDAEVFIPQLTAMQTLKDDALFSMLLDYHTAGVIQIPAGTGKYQSQNFSIALTQGSTTKVDIGKLPEGANALANGGVAITGEGKRVIIKANQDWVGAGIAYDTSANAWSPARADDVAVAAGYSETAPDGATLKRNSGNIGIDLILAPSGTQLNYFWIDYLEIVVNETGMVVEDETDAATNWFVKYIDGYQIFVTTTDTAPDGHPNAILLGAITVDTVGAVMTPSSTIDLSSRVYSRQHADTVTGNVGGTTDVPAVYENGHEVTLTEHLQAKGTGTVTPKNPHGLAAGDFGLENQTLRVITYVDADPININTSDGIIVVDASLGNLSLKLPVAASSTGLRYHFKRRDNTANTVTISPISGTAKIEGTASLAITGLKASSLVCDGTDWWIFAQV